LNKKSTKLTSTNAVFNGSDVVVANEGEFKIITSSSCWTIVLIIR
jgi:hypothetical protein